MTYFGPKKKEHRHRKTPPIFFINGIMEIESGSGVVNLQAAGWHIGTPACNCKFTRPYSASLGLAFSLMPQREIKVSKKQRSKCPKR
jgi:hypothetical protein